jgi:hypothetical protein
MMPPKQPRRTWPTTSIGRRYWGASDRGPKVPCATLFTE